MAKKRGPKPAPTAIKLLKGTRADRVNAQEPPPIKALPVPPKWLKGDALAEWERILPDLDELGVISRTDSASLVIYCTTHARWLTALRSIEEDGLTVPTDKGGTKTNPNVGIALQCERALAGYLADFGCNPSARSTIKSGVELAPGDELGTFLAENTA